MLQVSPLTEKPQNCTQNLTGIYYRRIIHEPKLTVSYIIIKLEHLSMDCIGFEWYSHTEDVYNQHCKLIAITET